MISRGQGRRPESLYENGSYFYWRRITRIVRREAGMYGRHHRSRIIVAIERATR